MFNRISDFVTNTKILNDIQYRLGEQRSSYMALLKLYKATNELDNNNYYLGVF